MSVDTAPLSGGAVGRLGRGAFFGARFVSSPSGEPLFALRQLYLMRNGPVESGACVGLPASRDGGSGAGARDAV